MLGVRNGRWGKQKECKDMWQCLIKNQECGCVSLVVFVPVSAGNPDTAALPQTIARVAILGTSLAAFTGRLIRCAYNTTAVLGGFLLSCTRDDINYPWKDRYR